MSVAPHSAHGTTCAPVSLATDQIFRLKAEATGEKHLFRLKAEATGEKQLFRLKAETTGEKQLFRLKAEATGEAISARRAA